jgi:LysR family transcriptional regulator, regulator of abg operon
MKLTMKPPIDPRAMRTFEVVCRAGSISGAARQLGISQPSVSSAITLLESRLGVTLFDRSRNGIILSQAGKAFLRHAQGLNSIIDNAIAEVELIKAGSAGVLRIGGTPGALSSLLPKAIGRLRSRLGAFSLEVTERPDAELTAMLLKREIDLAIVTTGLETPASGIREINLASDPFSLIVGRANFELPEVVSLREAGGFNWVLPAAVGAFRRQMSALFTAAQLPEPINAIRCDSLLLTKAIVRDTNYVTILPRQVAASELSIKVLRAIKIAEAQFERTIGVRMLEGNGPSPLVTALLEEIQPE